MAQIAVFPHMLRHTFLRQLAEAKGAQDAKETSGHQSDRYIWRSVKPSVSYGRLQDRYLGHRMLVYRAINEGLGQLVVHVHRHAASRGARVSSRARSQLDKVEGTIGDSTPTCESSAGSHLLNVEGMWRGSI
jgi:hypothetical protein